MLDRVLDRGIVIDASLQVSVAGISLIDVDVRVVVASIDTYVRPSETAPPRALFSSPPGPTVPRQPRRKRQAPVRLRCADGCTFVRPARRCPSRVRCPSDRAQACLVAATALAA